MSCQIDEVVFFNLQKFFSICSAFVCVVSICNACYQIDDIVFLIGRCFFSICSAFLYLVVL